MKNHLIVFHFLLCWGYLNAQQDTLLLKKTQTMIEHNLRLMRTLSMPYKVSADYLKPLPKEIQGQTAKFEYFSEQAREIIEERLQYKWYDEELKAKENTLRRGLSDTTYNQVYVEAKQLAKKQQKALSTVWDSVLEVTVQQRMQGLEQQRTIPKEAALLAAYLKDDRFVPYMLEYPKVATIDTDRLLARLEIEPYHGEYIEQCRYQDSLYGNHELYSYHLNSFRFNLKELEYTCSKESLATLIDYLDIYVVHIGDLYLENKGGEKTINRNILMIEFPIIDVVHSIVILLKNKEGLMERVNKLNLNYYKKLYEKHVINNKVKTYEEKIKRIYADPNFKAYHQELRDLVMKYYKKSKKLNCESGTLREFNYGY